MKKIFLCLSALSMALFTQAKIGYVIFTVDPGECSNLECYVPWDQDDESPERQAVSWFYNHYVDPSRTAENNYGEGKFLTVGSHVPASGTVPFSVANIADVDVLWINVDRAGSFEAIISNLLVKDDFEEIVRDFVKAGKNVLLTKQAARLVAETGRYTAVWPDFHGDAYAVSATNNYSVQEWWAGSHKVYNTLLGEGNMVALSTNSKSANRSYYWTMADDNARDEFQTEHSAKVLGIEDTKSGLIEFYPKGDYLGTMLVMGLNSYDWGATNSLLNKVQTLTQNMLDYLSASPNVQWATGASLTAGTIGYSDALTATANDGYSVAITSSDDNIGSYSDGAAHWNYFGDVTFTATATPNNADKGIKIPKNAPSGSINKSITVSGGSSSATIGYVLTAGQHLNLANEYGDIPNPDKTTAQWFYTHYVLGGTGQFVNPANDIPAAVQTLWIHSDRKDLESEDYMTELGGSSFVSKLRTYLAAGKNLFVSKQATRLIGDLQRLGKQDPTHVVYPTYGASSGGADSWEYGTHGPFHIGNSFAAPVSEEHSTHAIYKTLNTNPTLITSGIHTNRNYVINIEDWAGLATHEAFDTYQTTHDCRLLGDWGNDASIYECGGLIEFYPKDGVGEGANVFDQRGTIMMLGLAAYQWVNPTENTRTLTSNILSYLATTSAPVLTWEVEPVDGEVAETQNVQVSFADGAVAWYQTDGDGSVLIEENPGHPYESEYRVLNFTGEGSVTVTAQRTGDGYAVPRNVTPTSLSKTIHVATNIYVRNVSAIPDYYGTICLPRAAASYEGANMFRLVDKTATNGVIIEEVNGMAAGVPYIFFPTSDEVRVTMTGNKEAAKTANGLVGRLTALTLTPNENHYILAYNKIWQVDEPIEVPANRAYIDMSAINALSPAAGKKRYVIQGTSTVTALEDREANSLQNAKVLRNGTLYILKNGVLYNAQGQLIY